VRNNLKALENLVQRLDAAATAEPFRRETLTWSGISPEIVSGFLHDYRADRMAQRVRPRLMAEYIDKCAKAGELRNWTVCLVSSSTAKSKLAVGPYEVGPVTRKALDEQHFREVGRYTIRRVVSPSDEQIGLNDEQIRNAHEATKRAAAEKEKPTEPRNPSGVHLRRERDPKNGLLLVYPIVVAPEREGDAPTHLVGFQVSFPDSRHNIRMEYVANTIYLNEDIYQLDGDEDEA
jgi:hypothetical protein